MAFHKDSTASKSTLGSGGSFNGYDHQFRCLDSDVGSSLLRRRSLICFMSLKERSTVAVDTGSTIAMESRVLMFVV